MATVAIFVAVFLRLAAGASYLQASIKGKAKPSPVSWFFWGVIPIIAFAVQINQRVGMQALATLAVGICPLAVFGVAIIRNLRGFRFSTADVFSGSLAALGVILWLITSDAMLALFLSILADIASSIPTIIKSYRDPESEHPGFYLLSMLSMAITLCAISSWNVASFLFPTYILLINVLFSVLIRGRLGQRLTRVPRVLQEKESIA